MFILLTHEIKDLSRKLYVPKYKQGYPLHSSWILHHDSSRRKKRKA